eukprot:CFRG1739T1
MSQIESPLLLGSIGYTPSPWAHRLHNIPRLFGPTHFSPSNDLYVLSLGLWSLPFLVMGVGCAVYCAKYLRRACSPTLQDDPTIVGPRRRTRMFFFVPLIIFIAVFSVCCHVQFRWAGVVGFVDRNVHLLDDTFTSAHAVAIDCKERIDIYRDTVIQLTNACPELADQKPNLNTLMKSTGENIANVNIAVNSSKVAWRTLSDTWRMAASVLNLEFGSLILCFGCIGLMGTLLSVIMMKTDPQTAVGALHWLLVPTSGLAAAVTFASAGIILAFSIGMADYCMDPQLYSEHWLPGELQYILNCTAGDNPFESLYQNLEDEQNAFSTALLIEERARCESSEEIDTLVLELESQTNEIRGVIQKGQDDVRCMAVHKYYTEIAFDAICTDGTYDLSILILCAMIMSTMVLIPLQASKKLAAPLPYEDRIDYSYAEDDIPYESARMSHGAHASYGTQT